MDDRMAKLELSSWSDNVSLLVCNSEEKDK